MKYLFFDLEFANSRDGKPKICEFGYVVTDEGFRVLSRGNLIIDPNIQRSEWEYRVVKKILTRPIAVYERAPAFPAFYDRIAELIRSADMIFGHTMDMDAKGLNSDAKRYGLPPINFEFWDVHQFYIAQTGALKNTGLSAILEQLGIAGDENVHDAEADAYNTMLALRGLLRLANITPEEIGRVAPAAANETRDFVIRSDVEARERQAARLLDTLHGDGTNDVPKKGTNRRRLVQFIENARPRGTVGNRLLGKCVALSGLYEMHHFQETLHLLQAIVDMGGSVSCDLRKCNVYVRYAACDESGAPLQDRRWEGIKAAHREGACVEVWEWEELLSRLELSEEALSAMPPVSFDFLLEEGAVISDKKERILVDVLLGKEPPLEEEEPARGGVVYSTGNVSATLGDLFGDILSKFAPTPTPA